MGKCILLTHLVFYLLTMALTIAGIAMIVTCFVTDRWLMADDASELHYHGLYTDCSESYIDSPQTHGVRDGRRREVFKTTCTFKEAKGHDDMDGRDHSGHSHGANEFGAREVLASQQNHAHVFSTWNVTMIVLLACSGVCGIIALLLGLSASISFCSPGVCCGKCSTGFWFIFNGMASLLAIAATVYFAFKMYDPLFRTERRNTAVRRVEQEKGISYTYVIVADILFALASVFGLVCTVMTCLVGNQKHSATSKVRATPKINYVSNTSV